MKKLIVMSVLALAAPLASAEMVQCESCSGVNPMAAVAETYGAGTHYVFSLQNNQFRKFNVTNEGWGVYAAGPMMMDSISQQGFDSMRKAYVADPTAWMKRNVFTVQIGTAMSGNHNPVIIAAQGPNSQAYGAFRTAMFDLLASDARLRSADTQLADMINADGRLTGASGGLFGASAGAEWEFSPHPSIELRLCTANGDACALVEVQPGGNFTYLESRGEWGNGARYPTAANCTPACDIEFNSNESADAFRNMLNNAGVGTPTRISSRLRCGSVNGMVDGCVWVTTTQ